MDVLGNEDFGRPSKKLKLDNSEDKQFINYLSGLPSLESIAVVSLAGRLWNELDVKDFIEEYCRKCDMTFYLRDKGYRKRVENIIFQKLHDITLPNILKTNVSKHIKPMGLQLIEFLCKIKAGHLSIDVFFGRQSLIHWKMDRTIDKAKSLHELIKYVKSREDQRNLFHISDLYKFACNYCLEEHVSALWLSMSSHEQDMIENIEQDYTFHLVAYWTAIMKNELCNLMENIKISDRREIYNDHLTLKQNMVSLCIYNRNPFAMKYFWHHLREEDKIRNLKKWLKQVSTHFFYIKYEHQYFPQTYILCFLLSQLNGSLQQREVFQSEEFHSPTVLNSLYTTWSLKRYFLPTISVMLDYLDEDSYLHVMEMISRHIDRENEADKLMQEIWHISPLRLKIYYIQYLDRCPETILRLIKVLDFATIYLLLNEASIKQKKTIFFNMASFRRYIYPQLYDQFITVFISPCNRDLFDEFLSEILPTSSDIFSFKLKLLSTYAEYLFIDNQLKPQETFLSWVHKLLNELPDSSGVKFNTEKIFTALIFFDNFGLVDKFMEWAFRTEVDAYVFKKSLLRNDNNAQTIMSLMDAFSVKGVNGWDRLKKFLNYAFCTTEDISQFKNVYLWKLHVLFKNVKHFQERLDFCTVFLN